jgi:hypothetical protein
MDGIAWLAVALIELKAATADCASIKRYQRPKSTEFPDGSGS